MILMIEVEEAFAENASQDLAALGGTKVESEQISMASSTVLLIREFPPEVSLADVEAVTGVIAAYGSPAIDPI